MVIEKMVCDLEDTSLDFVPCTFLLDKAVSIISRTLIFTSQNIAQLAECEEGGEGGEGNNNSNNKEQTSCFVATLIEDRFFTNTVPS